MGMRTTLRREATIGGLTGLCLGAIAGPLAILFWGAVGATHGGALGATGSAGAFGALVDQVSRAAAEQLGADPSGRDLHRRGVDLRRRSEG